MPIFGHFAIEWKIVHELAIAQGIIGAIRGSLSPEQLARVKRINLVVGELTAVQEESLRFCIDVITKGTSLSGAQVEVKYVKPRFRCKACKEEYESSNSFFSPCPKCGSFGGDLLAGDELYLSSVELE